MEEEGDEIAYVITYQATSLAAMMWSEDVEVL